jgi:hypothetical protein
MEERGSALLAIVAEIRPATVRQVFYQAVVRGLIEKTELAYRKVQRTLVDLRRGQEMPYGWITDGTRWMRKPTTFDTLEQALKHTAVTYRKALWADSPDYVEVWIEKDALAGAVLPITSEFDVPLMVARGFASLSFLAEAAEYMDSLDKQVFVYQLGDHDPSGVAAGEAIEATLQRISAVSRHRLRAAGGDAGADHAPLLAAPPDQAHRFPRRPVRGRVRRWFGRA